MAAVETAVEDFSEHGLYLGVEVAVSGHVFALAYWVADLEICLHQFGVVCFVLFFFVEDSLCSEKIDSKFLLIELFDVEGQYFFQNQSRVFLVLQP